MKDLKDTLNEQLGQVNENKLTADKTAKFTQGNTEVVALDIPSGKKIFTMYDNESGEMDVISTDNIIEYLDFYGVPEQESNRINNLDVGEVWQNKLRTIWILIK